MYLLNVVSSKWPQGYKQRIVMPPCGIVVTEYKCKYVCFNEIYKATKINTLGVEKNAFREYLFSRINTDFLLISFFYADFDGISEKSTFRVYLLSRNQQIFAKLAKISTREN